MKQMQKKEEQDEEEGGLDDVSGGYIGGCIPIGPVVPEFPDGSDELLTPDPTRKTKTL